MWSETTFARLMGLRYPVVQAPMVGGGSTPELAGAVSEAGALGSLAAGLLTRDELLRETRETRARTRRPFSVNLFVPEPIVAPPRSQLRKAQALLRPVREELGLPAAAESPPAVPPPGQEFDGQVEAVVEARVPVVSFTFGLPSHAVVGRLHDEGARVLATVTCADEAREAVARGVDAVVAQGAEAGGHRGGWHEPLAPALMGTFVLVPQVVDAVEGLVPVVAAGGIMDGRGIAAALALGASGVQMGTAFLTTTESGAPLEHKRATLDARPGATVVTRAFTGKPARTLATPLTLRLSGHEYELPPYPVQMTLMQDVLKEAMRQKRADLMPMLAGDGAPLARELPARELVERLVKETDAAVERMAR